MGRPMVISLPSIVITLVHACPLFFLRGTIVLAFSFFYSSLHPLSLSLIHLFTLNNKDLVLYPSLSQLGRPTFQQPKKSDISQREYLENKGDA